MKRILLLIGMLLFALSARAQQPVQPLPQTGSPADAESNTSAQLPRAGVYGFMYNGTTWDRLRGDTTNGLWVNVKNTIAATISGTVTVAGSGNFTVVQATGTNLHVVCDSGCSSSSAPADEATFTFGSTSQTPVGGVFQTTATNNALTTGQMGAFQVTAQRALFTNLRNASGTEMGTSSNPLQVTGANGTFPVTGTFWQATQPVSLASGTVASGAIASGAVASGAFASGSIASGAVASGAFGSDSGSFGVGSTGSAVPAKGAYAGGNAATALPTAATAGNLTGEMVDKFGRQVVLPGTIRDLRACQTTTISASTSETTIVTAAGASVFADPYLIVVSNTSASTNTRVDFRDATAGTVLFSLYSIGGVGPAGFSLPQSIPQTTANNNWTAQAATSTTDLRVYVCYEKNK